MTTTANERAFWRSVWLMACSAAVVLPLFVVATGLAIWSGGGVHRAGVFGSFDRHWIMTAIASIAGLFAVVGPFCILIGYIVLASSAKVRRAILAGDDHVAPPAQVQPAPLPLPADAAEYPSFNIGDTRPWLSMRILFVVGMSVFILMASRPLAYIPPLGHDIVGTVMSVVVAAAPFLQLSGSCLFVAGFWTLWPALRARAGTRLFADDAGLHGLLDDRGRHIVTIQWSDARAFWTVHEGTDPSPSGWRRYALDAGSQLITWHFSSQYSSPQQVVGHTRLCSLITERTGLVLRDLTPGTLGRRIHDGPTTPLLAHKIPRAVRWALIAGCVVTLAFSVMFQVFQFP